MPYVAVRFEVIADAASGPKRAGRGDAASALCLADRWSELGYRNIRIVDPTGAVRTQASLRATLPIVKLMKRRLSKLRPAST